MPLTPPTTPRAAHRASTSFLILLQVFWVNRMPCTGFSKRWILEHWGSTCAEWLWFLSLTVAKKLTFRCLPAWWWNCFELLTSLYQQFSSNTYELYPLTTCIPVKLSCFCILDLEVILSRWQRFFFMLNIWTAWDYLWCWYIVFLARKSPVKLFFLGKLAF